MGKGKEDESHARHDAAKRQHHPGPETVGEMPHQGT